MSKKRVLVILSVLVMISVFTSSVTVVATDQNEQPLGTEFRFGAIFLTCSNIEGLDIDQHFGGLSNVDIYATSIDFKLATFPFWGTTMIEEEVELHITMRNFFGVIKTNDQGHIEIMGICRNIAWEFI